MSRPVQSEGEQRVNRPLRLRAFVLLHEQQIITLFLFSLFLWLAFNWIETGLAVKRFFTTLPQWDYWAIIGHFDRYRHFDLRVLWEQHNEHRIVFPELCFAIDTLFMRAHQILPLVCSYLSYLATFGLICWAVFQERRAGFAARLMACAACGIVMGWPGSALVIGIPFLLQWTMLELFVFGSLASLARYQQSRSSKALYLAALCGVAANYSSANGMLLWIIILATASLLRAPKRSLLALCGIAFVSISIFFVGYHRAAAHSVFAFLTAPLYTYGFLASYLSSPFGVAQLGTSEMKWQGIMFGSINLILFAVMIWGFRRTRALLSPAAIVLVGFSGFAILSGFATAAGRIDLLDARFSGATATRYLTIPLTNWAVLACGLIWLSSHSRWPRALPVLLTLFAVLFSERYFLRVEKSAWPKGTIDTFADQQWASLSVENDLITPDVQRILDVSASNLDIHLLTLRDNGLSVFDNGENQMLGKSLESMKNVRVDAPIAGEVVYTVPVEGGWELAGWDVAEGRIKPERLVLVDERNRVVGIGRKLTAGVPPDLLARSLPTPLAWVGFVNSRFDSKGVQAYLWGSRHRALIPIGDYVERPALLRIPAGRLGAPIEIEWEAGMSNWIKNATPLGKLDANPPGDFYSSWAGSDTSTGRLRSTAFRAPADGCVVLGTLHGPKTARLRVNLLDADTGKALVEMPLHSHGDPWSYWQIPVPPGIHSLMVEGVDEGSSWGEWLAVSQPMHCR